MAKLTMIHVDLIRDDLDVEEQAYVARVRNEEGDTGLPLDLGRVVLRYGTWQARDATGLNKKTVDTVQEGLEHLVEVYNASQ